MENEIQKIIDSSKKKRIKYELGKAPRELSSIEKKEIKENVEKQFKSDNWFREILAVPLFEQYLPTSEKQAELFELLLLEVSYKQSFKMLCDKEHPLIFEALEKVNLEEKQILTIIAAVQKINIEPLAYYLLFKDELIENDFSMNSVVNKIEQLSEDCHQGTIISHSAKMTHPACKYPKIFVLGESHHDGFIRTGNTVVDFDMHINATKLKVFKFFNLFYQGMSFLDHIQAGSNIFGELFKVSNEVADKWFHAFSSCIHSTDLRTDRLIKQIFFPVANKYHLLSLLQPSGLVFALKEKIDSINDRSPSAYLGKKHYKNKTLFTEGYSTISNLTVTKHGGDHPKNISGLNNKYQTFYLLPSLPPTIEKRHIHFPTSNFFVESIQKREIARWLSALQKIIEASRNNRDVREARDQCIQQIIDQIIEKMWAVRAVASDQFYEQNSQLISHQKTWLHPDFAQQREKEEGWLDKLSADISRWIARSYEKVIGAKAIKLGEEELKLIDKHVDQNREALR